MLDYLALGILLILCSAVIWIVVMLGRIPGRMAREADHPQAEAINILAWIGILTGGIGWLVALVWAKTVSSGSQLADDPALVTRLEALESRVAELGGEQ